MTTLEDAVYMGMRNDCSFVFNNDLNIFEHQSTVNPNMPLRDLFYLASILTRRISNEDLFRKRKVAIPNPRFVVFYQGGMNQPVRMKYRLSDLFIKDEEPEIELTVIVINIDPSLKDQVLDACRDMREFAEFVKVTRDKLNLAKDKGRKKQEQAVQEAIDYCIENGILADFLRKERKKVFTSILSDYNEQKVRAVMAEDAYTMGAKKGEDKFARLISMLLKDGKVKEAALAAEDEKAREEFYRLYGIAEEETISE